MRMPKSSTQKQSRKRREGKSALAEFDGVKPIADAKDSAVRPSWGQVAIMLVGSILVVVIVASIATALPFWLPSGSWATHMLVVLSPGYLLSALITPFPPYRGGLDFRAIYIAFFRQSGVLVRLDLLVRSLVGPAMAAEACCANRCLTRRFPTTRCRDIAHPAPG